MKSLLSTLFVLLLTHTTQCQFVVTEPGSMIDLSGEVQIIAGSPIDFEIVQEYWVRNLSNQDYTLGCRRIEVDVNPNQGMQSNFLFVLGPVYVDVGEIEVRTLVFSDTVPPQDSTFTTFLFRPNGFDGCSIYRFEWFNYDHDTEVFASLDFIIDHSIGECTTTINEHPNLETILSPNPTTEFANISISGVAQPVEIQILDLLGQSISKEQINPIASDLHRLDTCEMSNGIYFISIQDERQVLKTIKMVVKH